MQQLQINSQHLHSLKSQSLADLSQILRAGIAKVGDIPFTSFPVSNIHAYLYLQHLRQQPKVRSEEQANEFIEQIMIRKGNIEENEGDNQTGESLVLVDDQIIELIVQINPQIINNYSIQYKHKWLEPLHKSIVIKEINEFGIGNVVKLCIATLNNCKTLLTLQQSLRLAKYILFPAYFGSSCHNSKAMLQGFKLIIKQHSRNIMEELSHLFVQFYHAHWDKVNFDNTNMEHVGMVQNQLTLLQIIHFNVAYPNQLVKSGVFLAQIKGLLLFKGQNKSSIHPLCIKVYEKLGTCLNQLNDAALTFIKLFNILSCYGSHLIKDVWSSFYVLVESKQKSVYQAYELIDVILTKLQNHQNSNVIKNCLHQLLKNENSNRIFERTPSIIYSSLIRMLNLGVHYLDAMFHMDSRMYDLIGSFFLRFINFKQILPQQLQTHLKWLLEAIICKTNFDHALVSLLLIFQKQQKRTQFLTPSILDGTKQLLHNAYNRFPIRKRFQLVDSVLSLIQKNINRKEVTIKYLFTYLVLINKEYLMDENKLKIRKILEIYGVEELRNWAQQMIDDIKQEIRSNIEFNNEEQNLEQLYAKIRMVQFYQSICGVELKQYNNYLNQLITQYSQSQYKNIKQRTFIIIVYSIIKDSLISQLNRTHIFSPHLQAVLNSIVLYVEQRSKYGEEQHSKEIVQMVSRLFYRAYAYKEGQQYKQRQGQRIILARMLQWASDKLHTHKLALSILIAAFRTRISVLDQKRKKPNLYKNYQNLFEETLYELYHYLEQLQQSNFREENKCSLLSKDKQLRLRVLLITILINDPSHSLRNNSLGCSDIGDVVDRYDFQSYEEACWMIESIYCNKNKAELKSQEQAVNLVKQLELLLENMIQNLEYSLSKKQIVAICECSINLMFHFAYSNRVFSQSFVQFVVKLIKCGQSYLVFQRVVAILVTKQLFTNFDQICELNCQKLMPLLVSILSIEQYRGFDSAIYLYNENMEDQLYKQFGMGLQANYQGSVPRFLFIYMFKKILNSVHFNNRHIAFFNEIIHAAFEICMQLVVKQKMFLSGKNKLKLQMWQFLLVFSPKTLIFIVEKGKLEALLVRCVQCIGHNLISEIRYYSQMFLMRIITAEQSFSLISNEMLLSLQSGLLKSIGNIHRTISYIVVSGILINHISQYDELVQHFNTIRKSYVSLYNSLLTYVGSSVAYFRGLTQFFCLSKVSACLQTKYVSILRQNFLLDIDAKSLIQKLAQIMNQYVCDIKSWEIQRQILRIIPNQNYNVVCNRYYMDILKKFSTELAKINKNLDGFTAYRYIWKKHAASQQELQEEQEEAHAEEEEKQKEEEIFQRKIDPTLDHLYKQEHQSQLKLMATSSKSEALIGHLARTGEIFGINELIVPTAKIIESDQFKSISVTAERWLKISDLGGKMGQNVKEQNIIRALIKYKSQGFQIVKLSKKIKLNDTPPCIDMNEKCLLVLDEEQLLSGECLKLVDCQMQVGRHLSLHVQASIFIWSYFKRYVN